MTLFADAKPNIISLAHIFLIRSLRNTIRSFKLPTQRSISLCIRSVNLTRPPTGLSNILSTIPFYGPYFLFCNRAPGHGQITGYTSQGWTLPNGRFTRIYLNAFRIFKIREIIGILIFFQTLYDC